MVEVESDGDAVINVVGSADAHSLPREEISTKRELT